MFHLNATQTDFGIAFCRSPPSPKQSPQWHTASICTQWRIPPTPGHGPAHWDLGLLSGGSGKVQSPCCFGAVSGLLWGAGPGAAISWRIEG